MLSKYSFTSANTHRRSDIVPSVAPSPIARCPVTEQAITSQFVTTNFVPGPKILVSPYVSYGYQLRLDLV